MKKIIILLVASITMIGNADAAVKKVPQVIEELVKSMNSGDADAAGILGDLNCDGFIDFDRDATKAMIEKSYKSGSAFGKYSYGSALEVGRLGFEKNEAEGKRLVTEAIPALKEMAENNNAFACLMLYYIYNGGQSNEGQNVPESSKWLLKGEELGNPFCAYYFCKELLNPEYPLTPQAEDMMKNFENLSFNFRFPSGRVKNLYAELLSKAFRKLEFDLINWKVDPNSDGKECLMLFRNNRMLCNIFIRYSIVDNKYTLRPSMVYIEYNRNASIDVINTQTQIKYSADPTYLLAFASSIDKIVDWTQKVYTIFPPAFNKRMIDNCDVNTQRQVEFCWDGLGSVHYEVGDIMARNGWDQGGRQVSASEKDLLLEVLSSVFNQKDDFHSFQKKSQNVILETVKKQTKNQNLIDENFK